MSEQTSYMPQGESVVAGDVRRVTVLEALAQVTPRIGLSRSNQSTPSAGDADDQ